MVNFSIKLNSDRKTVGYTKEIAKKADRNSAAANALRKALEKRSQSVQGNDGSGEEKRRSYSSFDTPPKEYGKHPGTQHADLLQTGQINEDNIDDVILALENAISSLASIEKFDFHSAVKKYQRARTATVQAMVDKGISLVNPQDHEFYRNSLKEYSFDYCINQITIILWSSEKFCEDCFFDDKRGCYVKIIRGKRVYTTDILSPTDLQMVRDNTNTNQRVSNNNNVESTDMVLGKVQKSSNGDLRIVAIRTPIGEIQHIKTELKTSLSWEDIDTL